MTQYLLNRAFFVAATVTAIAAMSVTTALALILGSADSTGNTASASGAQIQLKTPAGSYGPTVNGALTTAAFTSLNQTVHWGIIDIKNNSGAALAVGLALQDTSTAPGAGPSLDLYNALEVRIEAIDNIAETCASSPGVGTTPQSASSTVVLLTDALGDGWVAYRNTSGSDEIFGAVTGTGASADVTAGENLLNVNQTDYRLCFYLRLAAGTANSVATGSLSNLKLTFYAE